MKIKNSRVIFPDKNKYRIEYSDDIVDIINQLLHKDKAKRLGAKGDISEILNHPFFKSIDVQSLLEEKLKPPFKPELKDGIDTKYFNAGSSAKDL